MLNKKLILLAILLISLLGISAVSAAEDAQSDIINADSNDNLILEENINEDFEEGSDDALLVDDSLDDECSDGLLLADGSKDSDDLLNDDQKCFNDLNREINSDNSSIVNLHGNYVFNPEYDREYVEGIPINRNVTIVGYDCTIDAQNSSRIFQVFRGGVTFIGIAFRNGNTSYDGGAIWGSCHVKECGFYNNIAYNGGAISGDANITNCSFYSNSAIDSGGAVSGGTLVDCYFYLNSAKNGGAVSGASLENCVFDNNSAVNGGALSGCSAVACNFTSNNASDSGGAVSGGSVENCIFKKNSAVNGGALSGCSAVACNFTSNLASDSGGAVSGGSVENCIFENNIAVNNGGAICGSDVNAKNCTFTNNSAVNGGAIYNSTATNCNFTTNNASDYGGAMFEGNAYDCFFKDNTAGKNGSDTYNTVIHIHVFNICDFTSTYKSGDELFINLTEDDIASDDINVTIKVYRKENNTLIGTYYCLSGNGWLVDFDVGEYIAVFSVENQACIANPLSINLTIEKAPTVISASAVIAQYNVTKYLVATLNDDKGSAIMNTNVSIVLNSKTYNMVTDSNGQVKLLISLVPNNYVATIGFAGNGSYLGSSKNVQVTVKKATPKIIASNKAFKFITKPKYKIVLKNGNNKLIKYKTVSIVVNGKTLTAKTNVKGVATFKDYYLYSITLKNNKNVILKDAKVTLRVSGKTFSANTNSKGQAAFKITNLKKKGKFTAVITYAGNKYYSKLTKKVKITVKK